jgi:hypothetical protein
MPLPVLFRKSKFGSLEFPALNKRIEFTEALKALLDSDAVKMRVVTLDEGLEVLKETFTWFLSLISEPPTNLQYRNPDLVVGETSNSTDRTIAGTVESRTHRMGPRIEPVDADFLRKFIAGIYGIVLRLQKDLQTTGKIQDLSIVDALEAWILLGPKENFPFSASAKQMAKEFPSIAFEASVKPTALSNSEQKIVQPIASDDQTHLSTIRRLTSEKNFLAYKLRKQTGKHSKNQRISRKSAQPKH